MTGPHVQRHGNKKSLPPIMFHVEHLPSFRKHFSMSFSSRLCGFVLGLVWPCSTWNKARRQQKFFSLSRVVPRGTSVGISSKISGRHDHTP